MSRALLSTLNSDLKVELRSPESCRQFFGEEIFRIYFLSGEEIFLDLFWAGDKILRTRLS